MNRNRKLLVAAAGLAAGALLGFLLPSTWIFAPAAMDAHAGHRASDTQYACPMFCTIMDRLPEDRRCPVCGMELTPVSGETTLSEHERMMIGLEATTIRRMPLTRSVRVVGEVDYDETRLARITTRMAGWLETVWADTTWAAVRKGDKLAAIYSPELYGAQKEYLVALQAGRETGGTLLRAAERRLKLLGIGDEEIAALRESGEVRESLTLRAPRDGVVIERRALEGEAVKRGERLYTTADLSRVWVQTEVFERDLVWIAEGQPVRLRTEGRPSPIVGRVAFIDPVLDRKTRTARVRIEVDNPADADGERALRVGQRVDAWIEAHVDAHGRPIPPGRETDERPLTLPRSAVLSTGERHVVYLLFTESGGQPDYRIDAENLPTPLLYRMVPVKVGPVASGRGEIDNEFHPLLGLALSEMERKQIGLEAIEEGMVVVTRGNLLLDSQAQLSGKPSLLFPEGSRGGGDPHAGH